MAKKTNNEEATVYKRKITIYKYSNVYTGVEHFKLVLDVGESNTDTSTWRPDISIARAQQGQNSGKEMVYDFEDGKDNGQTVMTFIRNPGLDITEVDSAINLYRQTIEKTTDAAERKKKMEELDSKLNENIQKIADSFNSSESTPTDSPTS